MVNFTEEEMQLIYKNYMEMDCYKVEEYINKIADRKKCSDKTIKIRIAKYAVSLGEKEYEEYLVRTKDVKLKKYDYVATVDELLEKNSNGEKIDYRKYNTRERLVSMIERYRKSYLDKSTELDNLVYEIEKYFSEKKKNPLENLPVSEEELKILLFLKSEQFKHSVQVINVFLNSNCSIEEYCHHNLEVGIKEMEQLIKQIFKGKWKYVIQSRRKDDNLEFINQLRYIIEKIKSENYDYIDYYMDTKLSFNDFIIISRKYGLDNVAVSKFANKYKNKLIAINRESELNATNIISGRTITREEKIDIFTFLDSNKIPVNLHSYKLAITKYLNGEISIETKHYTKKI